MTNRTLPNFREWARHLIDRDDVVEALEQAYTQGYDAGRIDYQDTDWQYAWDKEYGDKYGGGGN